jgi:hypothetical protein
MALKYFYYVVIATEDGAKFVTKTDYATKMAHWDSNEKPLALSKTQADDLALGLTLNFYPAFTLKSYHELKSQIFTKEQLNEEK